jgi:hypothetical protein
LCSDVAIATKSVTTGTCAEALLRNCMTRIEPSHGNAVEAYALRAGKSKPKVREGYLYDVVTAVKVGGG